MTTPATVEGSAERGGRGARRPIGQRQLTALLAFSMALAALGIDMILPAFGAIRTELGLASDSTAVAGAITAYFVGLAGGQLLYGPLADRFGRRPALYLGYGIYAIAALAATLAPTLEMLLVSRLVWGVGAAGPRVVTLAVIRDTYEGDRMSRAMSFVMAVFILVPVVAPSLGAVIVGLGSWRWVFAACALAALLMSVWALRLPETLRDENRMELRFGHVARATRSVVTNRQTAAYTLAIMSLYGVFASYLASSEIIFTETFDQGRLFPVLFGGLALVMGAAMLANARVVGAVGARRLGHVVLIVYVVIAAATLAVAVATDGRPPLLVFLVLLAAMLACQALLIPNFNTLALAPMGAIAGTASSVIGAVQTAGGAVLGAFLDRAFDGTILPFTVGFLGCATSALAFVVWAERGRLFGGFFPAGAAGPSVAGNPSASEPA